MNLEVWAVKWGVSMAALHDLRAEMGMPQELGQVDDGKNESLVQARMRIEASQLGKRLFRNNVGALQDARGTWVRYGLCNESAKMNKEIKSADLIGIDPVLITQEHVGSTIGRFLSREAKAPGWRYSGTDHEVAQLKWLELVVSLGGDAAFASGPGSFNR